MRRLSRWSLVAGLLLFGLSGPSAAMETEGRSLRGDTVPHWELFEVVLDTLVADYWNDDGNWDGDIMDDATSFAPEVLLGWGMETGDEALVEMGSRTCMWELALLDAAFAGDPDALAEAAMGALALWWGYHYDVNPDFEIYRRLLPPVLNWLAVPIAERFADDYWPASTLVGFMAHIDLELARGTRGEDRAEALAWASDLIDWAYTEQFDPGTGLFDDGYLTSNGVMLTAVAEHATLSRDPTMATRSQSLFDAMMTQAWDDERGGFWNESGDGTKHFSKNLMALRGIVALYDATGDDDYFDAAVAQIEWMKADLFRDGLFDHHWTEGIGRAGYVCTGCNFLFLDDMMHFRRAIARHRPHPLW